MVWTLAGAGTRGTWGRCSSRRAGVAACVAVAAALAGARVPVRAFNMSAPATCCADAEKFSVAYVTVPSIDVGKTIGHGLVKNKLAACVNIIPQVTSIYEWKNEINEDSEALLMIKTRTSHVDQLTEFVRSNHPYEVCEVISLPIQNGNPPYLKWIGDTVPEN